MTAGQAPRTPAFDNVVLDDVLIELQAFGAATRCCAVDPVSGIEVVVSGPSDSIELLERTAVAKLRRALTRRRAHAATASPRRGLVA